MYHVTGIIQVFDVAYATCPCGWDGAAYPAETGLAETSGERHEEREN